MYDINTKNVKKGKRIFYVFLIVGILFFAIIAGVFISSQIKLKKLDSTTTSTSVEINSHIDDEGAVLYSPTYNYEVDGVEYACSSNSSSSINPGTENKTVYYESSNPSNCMTEYSKSSNMLLLIFLLLPILFIVVAFININKVNKRVKRINELNKTGKLVKNLPYRLENSGLVVNGVPIQKPVVDYTLPSGVTVPLEGDPRNDRKYADADGMVDLVIDENNPDNYFIDYEINRLAGNQPSDYYNNVSASNASVGQVETLQSPLPNAPEQQIQNQTTVQSDLNNQATQQNTNQNIN